MKIQEIKKFVQYSLLFLSILMVLTGLGITHPGIIEPLTGGILGKMISNRIHSFLWGPLVIFLIIHIYLSMARRPRSGNLKQDNN
jgi:thiosulfate reductase cytochrome b subunit